MEPNKQLVALANLYASTLYLSLQEIVSELEQIFPWITFSISHTGDDEEPMTQTLIFKLPRPDKSNVPFISDIDKIYLWGLIGLISEVFSQGVVPTSKNTATWDEDYSYYTFEFYCHYGS